MPRKKKETNAPKKAPKDMTSEELAERVFPPKVLAELKRVAQGPITEPEDHSQDHDNP